MGGGRSGTLNRRGRGNSHQHQCRVFQGRGRSTTEMCETLKIVAVAVAGALAGGLFSAVSSSSSSATPKDLE